MKEDISPEERLLRLVKQGAKKSTSTPTSAPPTLPLETKKPNFALGIFKRFLRVRYLNSLLLFLLFLSLINLALNLIMPQKVSKIKTPLLLSKQKEIDEDLLPKMKPYDYYARQIGKRALFVPGIGKRRKGTSGTKSLTLQEIMQDFTLIGIKIGASPQAIIEDRKTKKTYFLKRGDYLGEIEISDIQKGKVILEYQGESFDLFL